MRPLRIEHRTTVLRPAAAWWIDSGDAALWLGEILRWGIDDSRCRLHVLPRSAHDPAPGSVLVVTGGQVPIRPPAAAPFGVVAGRIFLPVDAALLPAATDAELAGMVPGEALVFHPALGAVACGRPLAVADLLRAPTELDEPFADVPAVRIAHPGIEAIGLRVSETLDGMLGAMRDDIGTEPPAGLPPAKDEPSDSPLSRGWRRFRKGALHAFDKLIKGGGPVAMGGPIGKVREWVGKRIQALGEELDRARNREIHRLLEKLHSDPDAALRHALPLNGPPNRGLAPPSARLGERVTDFNLRNLGGGRPVDGWNLDYNLQRQLRENYVRLAERERQLGRFRRAAYIYAELLADIGSAALVLKEGRHWREAAMLYRDHLRKPLDAARCFVEARMPAEAVAIFEKERAWADLGELHRKLGDAAAAESAFRQWIKALLADRQPLKAADVLLRRLDSREEAITLLAAQWPEGADAEACVMRLFDLHGEAGEHTRARAAIVSLSGTKLRGGLPHRLLDWLVHVARHYPDRSVRLVAEETGRQHIARRLPTATRDERKRYIGRLTELVSEDHLLPRDAQRFLDASSSAAPVPAPSQLPREPGRASLVLQRDHQLPYHGAHWTNAVAGDQFIILAGFALRMIAACRLEFDGMPNLVGWTHSFPDAASAPRLIIAAPGEHLPHTFMAASPAVPLDVKILHSPPRGTRADSAIGTPTWVEDVLDAAMGISALWLLRAASHGWVVSGHRQDGSLVGQFAIDATLNPDALAEMQPDWHPSIAACLGDLVVSYVHVLVVFRSKAGVHRQVVDCESPILGLVPAPRWALPHVAVVMADRVDICWLNGEEPVLFSAIRDLDTRPVAGFSTDGTLVVIAGTVGYLVDADSHGRRKVARFPWDGTAPIAVLPGPAARTFTVVEGAGRVRVWRFSPGDLR